MSVFGIFSFLTFGTFYILYFGLFLTLFFFSFTFSGYPMPRLIDSISIFFFYGVLFYVIGSSFIGLRVSCSSFTASVLFCYSYGLILMFVVALLFFGFLDDSQQSNLSFFSSS
jgi:hypothetical protein